MANIMVGCALSDVNRADMPNGLRVPERLVDYALLFQNRVGAMDFSFELQPEDDWLIPTRFPDEFAERKTNRWWRAFRQNRRMLDLFRAATGPIGVHQPVRGRDALSSNFYQKYGSIAATQQAMSFAHFIGADYFVFHLAMQEHWGWERRDQMTKALKIFKFFEAYYHASNFKFVPCIELSEYPEFPATGGEACDLLHKCREIWPATQLIFDVSHMWGSMQRMIEAKMWDSMGARPIPFTDALDYGLEQTWEDIYAFHLGGCWESETHAIPGLHPQQDPFRYPVKLHESPGVYAEMGELDLNRTLDLILNYSVRKGRPLNLILEIFDRDIAQVLEATRVIREDLIQRAEQTAPPEPVLASALPPARKTRSTAKTKSPRRGRAAARTRPSRATSTQKRSARKKKA